MNPSQHGELSEGFVPWDRHGDALTPRPDRPGEREPFADGETQGRGGRGRLLIAAAALVWAVVPVLLLRVTSPEGAQRSQVATPPRPAATSVAGRSAGPATQADVSAAQVQRFGARAAPGPSEAAATAFLIARAWLGDVGSELPVRLDGPTTGAYVEHLAVESVDHPGPGAAVVTLLAVLLDVEDGRYGAARAVRLAVPVRLDSTGARPAGDPWWLPPPSLEADPPRWTAVDEPARMADAGAALSDAGYTVTQVAALEASPGWPLRATVHAVAPGEDQPRQHTVWLREHIGRLVVAGWLPAASRPGSPHHTPSPEEVAP